MTQLWNEKNIFKQSRVFRLYLMLLSLLSMVYVAIEIYKAKISKPLLLKAEITQLEFMELATLSTYAYYFESALATLSVIGVFLIFIKKYRPFLTSFIVIQLAYLVALFMLSNVLSWIFVAPIGNLTQHLIAPFILTVGMLIYFLVTTVKTKNVTLFN